jgi:drug/metabolite transporter (DMT)-like permease
MLGTQSIPEGLDIHIRFILSADGPRFLLPRRQLVQSSVSQKPVRLKTFLLILVMVIAGPLGNVLLSKGMKQAGSLAVWPPTEALHTVLRVLAAGPIWLGIASLLTFFLANVLILSWADYSYVQPASSVGYGVSALLGYFMLGEPVSPLRWLGIAIICLGVLVVGQSNPRSLEHSPTGMERS